MATNKTVVMAVRVPTELMATLRAFALANRRPLGMQVNIILEEGLKALGVPYGWPDPQDPKSDVADLPPRKRRR